MEIGDRIRSWRKFRGFNLRDFAAAIVTDAETGGTLDPGSLSRIENGKMIPKADLLESIARVLDLTMVEFYGDIPADDETAAANGDDDTNGNLGAAANG